MGVRYNPRSINDSVVCAIDFANVKNYDSTNLTAKCAFTGIPFTTVNPSYVNVSNGFAQFTRAASAPTNAEKDLAGGTIKTSGLAASSYTSAKVANFFYNNHTWEVLFRIDDIAPSNYDANETASTVVAFKGYNAGFTYSSPTLRYNIWNGTTNSVTCASWTIASETPVGTWNHVGVTRSGDLFTKYTKGQPISTLTQALTVNNGTTGTLGDIGIAATYGVGSNFINYGKVSVALFRMYSRALTDAEMLQNFAATRGRFNL